MEHDDRRQLMERISKARVTEELNALEKQYQFTEGYHLLYCPWKTLQAAEVAFVSLNPGRPPDGQNPTIVSDERGNSFEAEKETTKSPLTAQFLYLAAFLGVPPVTILTGTAHPFRSSRWADFSPQQRQAGLTFGRKFWSGVLKDKVPLVITLGDEATNVVLEGSSTQPTQVISSGWGSTKLKRFTTKSGGAVVQLPHLSTFKLFSRPECMEALSVIFKGHRRQATRSPRR
jgi:hypothetical protein